MLFLLAGMLTCIFIFVLFFLILIHRPIKISSSNSLFLKTSPNTETTTPTPPQTTENCAQFPLANGCGTVGTSINICNKQYPNYPSPPDILTTKADPNLGVYDGIISKLTFGLQSITVTSSHSGKSFVFTGGSVNGKIYDIHHSIVNAFYTLQTGMKAVVSFPCTQKTGYFTLKQFQLVQ